jgi:hypothetical protein
MKMSLETSRIRELERRIRELERLLGRKTMEVEILKEVLDVARVKTELAATVMERSEGRFPMTAMADTLANGPYSARKASRTTSVSSGIPCGRPDPLAQGSDDFRSARSFTNPTADFSHPFTHRQELGVRGDSRIHSVLEQSWSAPKS